MNDRVRDAEERFRQKAPFDLGIVHATREEMTNAWRFYYTRENADETESWYVARLNYEDVQSGRIPWDDIVHTTGPEAKIWINQQHAIYEFFDKWAEDLGQAREFTAYIHERLGLTDEFVIITLTAQQCIDRVTMARQFIQEHLLYSQVDG